MTINVNDGFMNGETLLKSKWVGKIMKFRRKKLRRCSSRVFSFIKNIKEGNMAIIIQK